LTRPHCDKAIKWSSERRHTPAVGSRSRPLGADAWDTKSVAAAAKSRHSSAFYTDCTELGRPLSAWDAPNKTCAKVRKDYGQRAMWLLPDNVKRCKKPIYVHVLETGEWEECCYLEPQSKLSLGMTLMAKGKAKKPKLLHCRALSLEDREVRWDDDIGTPLGTCGGGSKEPPAVPCDRPGETCLMPRQVGFDTDFKKEAVSGKTRHFCLAVGGRNKDGELARPAVVKEPKKEPAPARVFYLASPWVAAAVCSTFTPVVRPRVPDPKSRLACSRQRLAVRRDAHAQFL